MPDYPVEVSDAVKLHWIATHILPHEALVRAWLTSRARTLSAADADDLIQEAYARLWPTDFATIDNPRAFFFTVVRNLLAEHARRARIVPMERMGEIDALSIISEEPGPEQRVSARQELDRLRRILATLPPQCRRTFELRKFDGLTIRETAERLGVTQSTVEKHLTKAYARILDALDKSEAAQGTSSPTEAATYHGRDRSHKE